MGRNFYWIIAVLIIGAILNLGVVRKKEDPILKTQTDPVAYKKKKEELKDGPKGAPAPSLKFYGKEKFLVEPPMETEESELGMEKGIPEFEELVPEELIGIGKEGWEEDWWVEDWNESDRKSEKEGKEYLSQAPVASKEGEELEEEERLDWWMEDWS